MNARRYRGWIAATSCVFLCALGCQSVDRELQVSELADAIRIQEQAHNNRAHDIEAGWHLAEVDYRSILSIDFDEDKIREIADGFGRASGVIPPEAADEAELRERAGEFLKAAESYVKYFAETNKRLESFRARGEGSQEDLEAMLAKRANEGKPLIETLKEAAQQAAFTEARANGWSIERDEDDEFFDERTEELYYSYGDRLLGDGVSINLEALAEMLSGQFGLLVAQAEANLAAAEEAGELRLRVQSRLIKDGAEEPLYLHMPGYDSFDEGEAINKRAVSFNLSASDRMKLRERLKVAKEFADFANQIRSEDSEVRTQLKDLGRNFEESLSRIEDRIDEFLRDAWDQGSFGSLLEMMKDDARHGQVKSAVDTIEELEAAGREINSTLDRLTSPEGTSIDMLANLFEAGSDLFSQVSSAIDAIPDQVDTIVTGMSAAQEFLTEQAQDSEQVGKLLARLFPEGWESGSKLLKDLAAKFPVLADVTATAVARLTERTNFSDNLEVDSSKLITRSLDRIVDTSVSLNRYPADMGDEIIFSVDIVEQVDGQETSLVPYRQEFAVERMGLYNTLDAHVIFVERVNEPDRDDARETNFAAAPAASWMLHYRKREYGPEADSWAATWNTINPGIGLCVAALGFENDGSELGVGAHLTFLGDLLQVGYGANLNVEDERAYWYVGIGLVEALNIAGLGLKGITTQ